MMHFPSRQNTLLSRFAGHRFKIQSRLKRNEEDFTPADNKTKLNSIKKPLS